MGVVLCNVHMLSLTNVFSPPFRQKRPTLFRAMYDAEAEDACSGLAGRRIATRRSLRAESLQDGHLCTTKTTQPGVPSQWKCWTSQPTTVACPQRGEN